VLYYENAAFLQGLAKSTQGPQRSLLERRRKGHGKLPLRPLGSKHIRAYISKLESASVQRNMLRAIRHFTKFALGTGLIDADPAVSVTRAKMTKTQGFFTWSEEHVAKFEERHPVGTKARLALALYLNLGVRKSDVVRVGPRYVRNGMLSNFLPQKGERTEGNRYGAPQIAAISGHKDLREIQLYIEKANREKMGMETLTAFEQAQIANRNLLTE
jgi:intergrase/recombinase